MTKKLNLFTLFIFAYSIIVCATFKKDNLSTDTFSKSKSKPTNTISISAKLSAEIKAKDLVTIK